MGEHPGHTPTSFCLSIASFVIEPGDLHNVWCDHCSGDGTDVQLLAGRCGDCGGLLVACDDTDCIYALECECRLPRPQVAAP